MSQRQSHLVKVAIVGSGRGDAGGLAREELEGPYFGPDDFDGQDLAGGTLVQGQQATPYRVTICYCPVVADTRGRPTYWSYEIWAVDEEAAASLAEKEFRGLESLRAPATPCEIVAISVESCDAEDSTN